ncbi:DUF1566 domain-containing protein [Marinobacterium sp. BA1]|uniref:Lcl C-terminal domain-containing protein n=1 Tax=Marinobacterium sp. BA1 TaxID=3138931 RepID=UPI0032E71CF6
MKNVQITTPDNSIRINLADSELSIAINPQVAAEPTIKNSSLEWSGTLLDGEAVTYTDAEEAVAALGQGWRLPTRQELESILDLSCHDPAIDTDTFPDTQSSSYWTSTPCAWNDSARWVVFFYYGYVNHLLRYYGACVRAVRAGQ